jgi:low affinity Fe/Cu permease
MVPAGYVPVRGIRVRDRFRQFAGWASHLLGSPGAFVAAAGLIVAWALLGPRYGWSTEHSLAINSATTVVTFLAVFLIQNTQNRNDAALQLKLDELLRSVHDARNSLIAAEKLPDPAIEQAAEELRSWREGPAG